MKYVVLVYIALSCVIAAWIIRCVYVTFRG